MMRNAAQESVGSRDRLLVGFERSRIKGCHLLFLLVQVVLLTRVQLPPPSAASFFIPAVLVEAGELGSGGVAHHYGGH